MHRSPAVTGGAGTATRRSRHPSLPPDLRLPLALVSAVATVVVVVLALWLAGDSTAGPLDRWAVLRSPPSSAQYDTLLLIDYVGEPVGAATLVGLLALLCLALGRRRLALVAVLGLAAAALVVTTLKPLVGRTIHGDNLAFPSGHTATATVLGLVVMLLIVDLVRPGRWIALLLVLTGPLVAATTMAVAQIALGAHYPTDTVGGFCCVMALVPLLAWSVDALPARADVAVRTVGPRAP